MARHWARSERSLRFTHLFVACCVLLCLLRIVSVKTAGVIVRPQQGSRALLGLVQKQHQKKQQPKRMNLVPMRRVKFTSVQDFYQRYGDEPVIIEGGIKHHPFFAHNMTFESLASMCDGAMIDTVRHDPTHDDWAGHDHQGAMPFKQYVHEHILNRTAASAPAAAEEAPLYAMCDGFGLPIFCPALNDVMPVPHIGTRDLPLSVAAGEEAGAGSNYNPGQPSLFAGPANTISDLHMDNGFLPLWLSVYLGSKTMRVITWEDSLPHWKWSGGGEDDSGEKEGSPSSAFNPAESRRKTRPDGTTAWLRIWDDDDAVVRDFPELARMRVFEGTGHAGDLIYLPVGAWHAVRNDEASFASSINFMPPALAGEYLTVASQASFGYDAIDYIRDYFGACLASVSHPLNETTVADLFACVVSDEAGYVSMMNEYRHGKPIVDDEPLHAFFGFDPKTGYADMCARGVEHVAEMLDSITKREAQGVTKVFEDQGQARRVTESRSAAQAQLAFLRAHCSKHRIGATMVH